MIFTLTFIVLKSCAKNMILLCIKAYGLLLDTKFRGHFSLVEITVNLCTEQISQLHRITESQNHRITEW